MVSVRDKLTRRRMALQERGGLWSRLEPKANEIMVTENGVGSLCRLFRGDTRSSHQA
jgi:hypothetical protein